MPHPVATTDTMLAAVAGQLAFTEHAVVLSRIVQGAANIPFGRVVVQGAADQGIILPSVGQTRYVGITCIDQSVTPWVEDAYPVASPAGVLVSGSVWVQVSEAVTVGDAAFFVPATGLIVRTVGSNIAIPNSRFDTSAAINGLAILRIA